jgi:HAD superfamily hydrolase (TIGR01450 family)
VTPLLDITQPLSKAFDGAISDLDGVLFRGADAVPHAPAAVERARAAGMNFAFLTNNASRTPGAVAAKLGSVGIPASANQVVTAAQAGAELLAQELPAGAKVLVVGAQGLISAVEEAGFKAVFHADDAPAAVIQGWGPNVGWKDLAEAAYAIGHGAKFFASNLDRTLPTEFGLAPGNGSLVQALVSATGVTPKASGKPQAAIFQLAAQRIGAKNPLVIGDRLDTDLAGANNAGFAGLMVMTGVNRPVDAFLAPPSQRPGLLAWDLRALANPHRAPQLKGERWVSGESEAWVANGRLRVTAFGGQDTSDDALRAAAAACWSAIDAGQPVVEFPPAMKGK